MAETAMTPPGTPSGTPSDKAVTRSTKDLTKAAVSGWLGTAMEFMDFQLYSLAAAIVFNQIFFPDVSPAIGLIAAMATYGVGYVARLAGAIYFGRMGDRIGRRKVLFITVALMGVSTTLIGVLPTYQTVGILAPILLVVLRLIQGFGAGAEIAGATVMLAEYAPVRRRGLVASLVSLGTNSGTLAASALWALLLAVLSERAAAELGLAAAVPAQLRAHDLRRLDPHQRQGEPGLRGPRRRRRRRGPLPRRGSRPGRDRGAGAPGRPARSARARRSSWRWPCGSVRPATPGWCRPSWWATSRPRSRWTARWPPRPSCGARIIGFATVPLIGSCSATGYGRPARCTPR